MCVLVCDCIREEQVFGAMTELCALHNCIRNNNIYLKQWSIDKQMYMINICLLYIPPLEIKILKFVMLFFNSKNKVEMKNEGG